MCFIKWESLVGGWVLNNRIWLFEKKKVLQKSAKLQFSAYMQTTDSLQIFYLPTSISHFRRNKDNVHSPI